MERLSWLTRRRVLAGAALAVYAAIAVKLLGGLPASRDVLVPLLIGGFLLLSIGSVTRLRRLGVSLAVDWLPFVLMLWLYDLVRGYADGLWLGIHVRPQIDVDRWLGLGSVPTVWLQQHLWHGDADLRWYDYATWLVYMSYFFGTTAVLAVLWWKAPALFRRFAAMVVALAFVGCATYVLFPAAPPWLAGEDGDIPLVDRLIGPVSGHVPIVKFEPLWESGTQYSNAVAAVPSLHAGYTFLIVLFLFPRLRSPFRYLLWLYPPAMAFALVYSGEHYFVDVLVGWLYAAVVYAAVDGGATVLRRRRDRDPAARLLPQGDVYVLDD
ncbi:MAG TPA: phosphatase PAP2 family protein [Gaiellaceae bacterium]|jgi:membrane-associated phospholipid phosphatase